MRHSIKLHTGGMREKIVEVVIEPMERLGLTEHNEIVRLNLLDRMVNFYAHKYRNRIHSELPPPIVQKQSCKIWTQEISRSL